MKLDLKSFGLGILLFILLSAGTITTGIVKIQPAQPKYVKVVRVTLLSTYDQSYADDKNVVETYLKNGWVISNTIRGEFATLVVFVKY